MARTPWGTFAGACLFLYEKEARKGWEAEGGGT